MWHCVLLCGLHGLRKIIQGQGKRLASSLPLHPLQCNNFDGWILMISWGLYEDILYIFVIKWLFIGLWGFILGHFKAHSRERDLTAGCFPSFSLYFKKWWITSVNCCDVSVIFIWVWSVITLHDIPFCWKPVGNSKPKKYSGKKNKKPLSWFIFKGVAPPFIIKGLSFVFHLAKSIPKTLLISCQVDEVVEDIYVCFYHHMVDAFKCFSGRVNLCKHHVASFVFVAFCHHARATLMFCWLLKCLWYMISCAKRRFFGRKLIFGTCALEQDTGMCLSLFWFAAEILEPDGTYSRLFSVLFFFFCSAI